MIRDKKARLVGCIRAQGIAQDRVEPEPAAAYLEEALAQRVPFDTEWTRLALDSDAHEARGRDAARASVLVRAGLVERITLEGRRVGTDRAEHPRP